MRAHIDKNRFLISALISMIVMLACALPVPLFSTPQPAVTGIVPGPLLTQVAATIRARVTAFQTDQGVEAFAQQTQFALTASPIVPTTPVPTQVKEPATQVPTAALEPVVPSPTPIPNDDFSQLPPPPPPPPLPPGFEVNPTPGEAELIIPQPLPPSVAQPSGEGFSVVGLHLANCRGNKAANFLVFNTGAVGLESLKLYIFDRASGSPLFGPVVSNLPFTNSDRNCQAGGISRLESDQALYVGGLLNTPTFQGQLIQADVVFCTQDDLNGTCYSDSIEFTAP